MTTTQFIMLLGIAVSAFVALTVASQQRKQMRQIELYKQNPSVGLVPPDSTLTRFVKSKWDVVLGFGGPIVSLAFEFMANTPLTRLSVFLISLNVAFLLTNMAMTIMFRVVDRIFGTVERLAKIVDKNFEVSKGHFDITTAHTRVLEKLNAGSADEE